MSQTKDKANKLIFTLVIVVAVATLTLLGMSGFTPVYNKAKVEALLGKQAYASGDYAAMLHHARVLESNLSSGDEARSDEEQAEMFEAYLSLTDLLAEGEGKMDASTRASYHQWLEDSGATD